MTRRLSNLDVLRRMTGVFWLSDSATTGTTDATAAKGTKDVTVGTGEGANFTAGDEVRIGANGDNAELAVIESIATDVLTMKLPLSRAIASGETVTKLTPVDVGATDENGVQYTPNQNLDDIEAGTQLDIYLSEPGPLVRELNFNLRDFNPENLAVVFGIDETDTDIVDPKGVTLNPDDFLSVGILPWKAECLLKGGEAVTVYWNGEIASVNGNMQFAFGTATVLPVTQRLAGSQWFLIE